MDRNRASTTITTICTASLSARRAWIEIPFSIFWICRMFVALRKESVDRNIVKPISYLGCFRSLSARRAWIEIFSYVGVMGSAMSLSARRAWIEIYFLHNRKPLRWLSLSARRAWIEIPAGCWRESRRAVALRKESVDRNYIIKITGITPTASLSARRAWIEINRAETAKTSNAGRSPQGERG